MTQVPRQNSKQASVIANENLLEIGENKMIDKYNFQEDGEGDWIAVESGNHLIARFREKNHAIVFTKLLNKEWSVITIKAEESGLPQLDCTLEDILEEEE